MPKYFVLLLTVFLCTTALAQNNISSIDTTLKFDKKFTDCERRWVVLSRRPTDDHYTYGFIYIDEQAGFTFDLKGTFKVSEDGRYMPDTTITRTGSIKYRIAPNWQKVALLPADRYKELNLLTEPMWAKNYYSYTDTVTHNYRLGFIYNASGDSKHALHLLLPAYSTAPHNQGIAFELAYAYNALDECDKAIPVLNAALKDYPNDMLFYKELGYAYAHLKRYEQAIVVYQTGLQKASAQQSETKGEIAFNAAQAYKVLAKQDQYKEYMLKAKSYTPPTSPYYKLIIQAGF